MIELRAKFEGRVHGVGFRATTAELARKLNLKGVVSNKSDGSVELIAQGEKPALEELIAQLQALFGKKYIEKFHLQYLKPAKIFFHFSIE
jgi:acylphosphatase